MRRQVALARGAGLGGFVHYFYWFNGHRLLEKPMEAMLADRGVDFPFCLMWANENWTRRWDGGDKDVLIAQDNMRRMTKRWWIAWRGISPIPAISGCRGGRC